jgi:hypothetical protein
MIGRDQTLNDAAKLQKLCLLSHQELLRFGIGDAEGPDVMPVACDGDDRSAVDRSLSLFIASLCVKIT